MEKFEFGKVEDTIEMLSPEDLMVEVSGMVNWRIPLGSHVQLVSFLGSLLDTRLIFKTCSGSPLYSVKWHELSEAKKAKIKGHIK